MFRRPTRDWTAFKAAAVERYRASEDERLFLEAFAIHLHEYARVSFLQSTDGRLKMNEWWGIIQDARDRNRQHAKRLLNWIEPNFHRVEESNLPTLMVEMGRDLKIQNLEYVEYAIRWFLKEE